MPGFDCSRFVGLSEKEEKYLSCSICLNIFDNCVTADCGHNYCKLCIEEWIESHPNETSVWMYTKKRCPVCRQVFRRKRCNKTRDEPNLMCISGYVFVKSLVINQMVSDLRVKCDFQSNGCKEVTEFGLLSTHVTHCEYRLCKTCGLSAGKVGEHNCIELLKRDRNQLQDKRSQIIKQMEENISQMNTLFDLISKEVWTEEEYQIKVPFDGYTDSYKMVLKSNELYFQLKCFSFSIEFTSLEQLMYCSDSSLPLIILRTDWKTCDNIRDYVYIYEKNDILVDNIIDIIFGDETEKQLIFEISKPFNDWISLLMMAFKANSKIKFQSIDSIKAKQLLESVRIPINQSMESVDTSDTNDDSDYSDSN